MLVEANGFICAILQNVDKLETKGVVACWYFGTLDPGSDARLLVCFCFRVKYNT
jgi:hypothetical protein